VQQGLSSEKTKFAEREGRPGPALDLETKGPREETVSGSHQRIEAMHKRDVLVAWAFVIGLWFAVIFVALATWNLAPTSGARTLC
jgi:hypothetical protein